MSLHFRILSLKHHFYTPPIFKLLNYNMINNLKTPPASATQLPKIDAEASSLTSDGKFSRNYDVMFVVLRMVSLSSSLISIAVLTSAKEKSTVSIYGFQLSLYSKWSFSGSFEYLVCVSAVVAFHSLLQLVMTSSRMLRKSSIFSSRNHAWIIFASDQVFAYAMMSAVSAATGVTNLNRTGIKHQPLPNFCKPLHSFCDRVGVSIAFAFFNCFLLAVSTVLDVLWLTN